MGWELPAEAEPPECPEELAHVMGWFIELSAARQPGFAGLAAITYADIDAWKRLTGREPDAYEVGCLTLLDAHFRSEAAALAAAERERKKQTGR